MFLSDWSLNFIIFIMVLLHHFVEYYITKLYYSILLYLIMSWLFIHYFLYHSFSIFIFILLLILLSPFKLCLILCCICCFIWYWCHCIYYHFTSLFMPRNPLSQIIGKRTIVSFFFFSRHIWRHAFFCFF